MLVQEISDGGVGNHLVAGVAAEIATSNLDKVKTKDVVFKNLSFKTPLTNLMIINMLGMVTLQRSRKLSSPALQSTLSLRISRSAALSRSS